MEHRLQEVLPRWEDNQWEDPKDEQEQLGLCNEPNKGEKGKEESTDKNESYWICDE